MAGLAYNLYPLDDPPSMAPGRWNLSVVSDCCNLLYENVESKKPHTKTRYQRVVRSEDVVPPGLGAGYPLRCLCVGPQLFPDLCCLDRDLTENAPHRKWGFLSQFSGVRFGATDSTLSRAIVETKLDYMHELRNVSIWGEDYGAPSLRSEFRTRGTKFFYPGSNIEYLTNGEEAVFDEGEESERTIKPYFRSEVMICQHDEYESSPEPPGPAMVYCILYWRLVGSDGELADPYNRSAYLVYSASHESLGLDDCRFDKPLTLPWTGQSLGSAQEDGNDFFFTAFPETVTIHPVA
ncbi:hypothetical protein SH661x_001940 [Planctomicrobium sp. SH661]|uniref:hypothetical protein n=1 Tax=Planctomicrobium sp. SH661 TaxID=3448124 RepID=UPI003F5CA713